MPYRPQKLKKSEPKPGELKNINSGPINIRICAAGK
jgi:hypothetical protein